MELRHLRYLVAVAEEGSFTIAASKRLHTAQPSLSRQLRDLEAEVGAQLLLRGPRGVELTAAGRAFVVHARAALAEAAAAIEAARQAARPQKASLGLGFLTGQELTWLPSIMGLIKDELPAINVKVTSDYSPILAEELVRGEIDLALMRAEAGRPELSYYVVATEPLKAILPSDHRLATRDAIVIEDLAGETFIGMSDTAPVLKVIIDDYLTRTGVDLRRDYEIDNLSMAISLVASTRSVTLLPAYAENFLPWSVVSRPLQGSPPTIDLVVAWRTSNGSPPLQAVLSRLDLLSEVRPPIAPPTSKNGVRW